MTNRKTALNKITDKVTKFDKELNKKTTKRVDKESDQSNLHIYLSLIFILVYGDEEDMEEPFPGTKKRKGNNGLKLDRRLERKL